MQQFDGAAQQYFAVNHFVLRIVVREVVANVAQVSSAEKRVAQGVYEYVGVAVAQQTEGVAYFYASQPQGAATDEAMHVEAHTDTYVHV